MPLNGKVLIWIFHQRVKRVKTLKHIILSALVICVSLASVVLVHANTNNKEKILSFHSAIKVLPDATMTVTETIKVNCNGDQIKHGIYRDFPAKYRDRIGNKYIVGFMVSEVLSNGFPEEFRVQNISNGKRVYIGKKDVLLTPGVYTYTLTYQTNRQLGFFKDFDELYWNVTGNGWSFPIEEAAATVELPGDAAEKIIATDGFTGFQGSTEKYFTTARDSLGNIVFRTSQALAPKAGLTIVLEWPKGYVQEPSTAMKLNYFYKDNQGTAAGLAGVIILVFYYLLVWAKVGKDPEKGTIIPLYNPPQKLSPAAMRYITKMSYDNKAFTAALLNMAIKGFIRINDEKDEYSISTIGKDKKILSAEELAIARELAYGFRLELKNSNHHEIQKMIVHLRGSLKNNFEKVYFFTNKEYFIPGLLISVLIILLSGYLEATTAFPVTLFMSVWLIGWTIGVFFLLSSAFAQWKGVIKGRTHKISTLGSALFITLFSIPFIAGEIFGLFVLVKSSSVGILFILAVCIFINILFYHLLKAPTLAGRKLIDQIAGFKMYLAAAEKDRLNILIPPQKSLELFEKYLPYAIALDVEQAWAEQFADVLQRASLGGDGSYHPHWYHGTAWNTLGATGFAAGFSSSFSSAISSSSIAPGSSSGGSGGSSGGGGGGGGGGGW